MESIWKPNTNYYIKLNVIQLQEILDDTIVNIVGYDPSKKWLLGDVCRGINHLENDEVAINIQVCNPQWTNVELKNGSVINALGVLDYINTQDFDLAKYYFKVDKFLTQNEYDNLINIDKSLI